MIPKVTKAQKKAAIELGKSGGQKRRDNLSPERRQEIAKKAAKARWEKSRNQKPLKNKAKH